MTDLDLTPLSTYNDLKNKGIFISGGATGIGRDLVIAFHQQGSRVLFVDINAAAGEALCHDLNTATGSAPIFIETDVTNDADLQSAIEKTDSLGDGLYALLNNAAFDQRHRFEDIDADMFRDIIDVNLRHQFKAAQVGYSLMKKRQQGSIINFGSVAPKLGAVDLDVYGACKMGAHSLTRSMARKMGADFIRVNTIVPGCILTPRQLELWISPADEAKIRAQQCIDRRLVGKDIAHMALFLASMTSAACTSQEFVVDGGIT
jgi:NAD(P)-dependent dehydrogenase (short-subunit alcohol dehydrogenase family)